MRTRPSHFSWERSSAQKQIWIWPRTSSCLILVRLGGIRKTSWTDGLCFPSQFSTLFPETEARLALGRSSARVFLLKQMFYFDLQRGVTIDPQRSAMPFKILPWNMLGSCAKKRIFPFPPISIDISGAPGARWLRVSCNAFESACWKSNTVLLSHSLDLTWSWRSKNIRWWSVTLIVEGGMNEKLPIFSAADV